MKRLMGWTLKALLVLGVIAGIRMIFVPEDAAKRKASEAHKAATMQLARSAIASLRMVPEWRSIEINEADDRDFSFTLDYREYPSGGLAEVESDTKLIARATLAALINSGHQPAKEYISVFVFAQQSGLKGETGVELVRLIGHTSYDYGDDSLVFKPYKN